MGSDEAAAETEAASSRRNEAARGAWRCSAAEPAAPEGGPGRRRLRPRGQVARSVAVAGVKQYENPAPVVRLATWYSPAGRRRVRYTDAEERGLGGSLGRPHGKLRRSKRREGLRADARAPQSRGPSTGAITKAGSTRNRVAAAAAAVAPRRGAGAAGRWATARGTAGAVALPRQNERQRRHARARRVLTRLRSSRSGEA